MKRSEELGLSVGSVLLNQMAYIIEVLMKFEPSLQLTTRTTPGNQESFASTQAHHPSTDQAVQEYIQSLQALAEDDIIEADKLKKTSPKLHYNSDQVPINLPAIAGCLKWIALRTRPDIAWATSQKGQQGIVVYHGITSSQRKGGNLVQWRSGRLDLIAKSTCEVELTASSEPLQQGENISIVISEMVNASCDTEVSSDNAAALHMVRNGSETAWRTRHISAKALWLHRMSKRGIKFTYQPTSEMAADSLTKGLGASRLPQIKEDLCLVDD